MILFFSTEGALPQSQIQNDFRMIKLSALSDCGLKLKRPCLIFYSRLNSSFIYIQIKYALKAPHHWKERMFSSCVRGRASPPTRPLAQQPWKNSVASLATGKEAPMRKLISVQIYMI